MTTEDSTSNRAATAAAAADEAATTPPQSRIRPRRVAVLYHPHVEESLVTARQLAEMLSEHGAHPMLHDAWEWGASDDDLAGLDWVITLGGDGTVLRAVRQTAERGIPITGVNFGRLGFLAELEPREALRSISDLAQGGGHIEERLMLRCRARIGGQPYGPVDALNDIFVGRGRVAHAVRLDVSVDDVPLVRFVADGLVVATPTGSTAYSLSAGGSVIGPGLDALMVTPVVPHPNPVRPIVLQADSCIDIWLGRGRDAILTIDGQVHEDLLEGDSVRVTVAPRRARFLRLEPASSFYDTLIERLRR
ncbi:MAG: NAD(+)/NADH kinase [Anaerolineae bacterium]